MLGEGILLIRTKSKNFHILKFTTKNTPRREIEIDRSCLFHGTVRSEDNKARDSSDKSPFVATFVTGNQFSEIFIVNSTITISKDLASAFLSHIELRSTNQNLPRCWGIKATEGVQSTDATQFQRSVTSIWRWLLNQLIVHRLVFYRESVWYSRMNVWNSCSFWFRLLSTLRYI